MKQKLLNKLWLRVGMIVAIMTTALSGTVWADTSTVTASKVASSSASWTGSAGETWSVAVTGGATNQNVNNGYAQVGTKNSPSTSITLSTSGISGTITSVVLDCASYDGLATVSCTVGGSSFGTQSQSSPSWSNNAGGNVTFNGSASGAIVITMTNGSGGRAMYIKSITVTYTPGGSTTETVATPTFSPAEGTYTSAQNVEISTTTTGATIYYTTDGNDPTTSSSVYSSAISVSTNTTIKAMAVKDGMDNSSIASATYIIKIDPALAFSSNTAEAAIGQAFTAPTLTNDHNLTVTWSSTDEDVATVSDGVVTLVGVGTTTIKASYAEDDTYIASEASYTLTVTDPSVITIWSEDFSSYSANDVPSGGTYGYSCGGTGTKIYDAVLAGGTTPELLVAKNGGTFTAVVPLNNATGTLTLTYMTNAKAMSVSTTTDGITGGGSFSTAGEHTVTFTGVTTAMTSITIVFTATSGDNVRLDDILLRGRAQAVTVEAPTFSVNGGTYYTAQSVELSCATDGATIYYTTNGDEPTSSSTQYTGAITVDQTMTIKAIAIKGGDESTVSSATYTITEKNDVVFSITDKSIAYGETYTVTKGSYTGRDIQTDGFVTVSTDNAAVASVSEMTITAEAVGTATITLTAAEGDTYKAGSTTITITVTAPTGQTKAPAVPALFKESFNAATGSGPVEGEDWGGSIASKAFAFDNEGWTAVSGYSGNNCVRLGTGSVQGSATTPAIAFDGTTTYTLSFKAGAWKGDGTTLTLTCDDEDAEIGTTEFTMDNNAWKDFSTTVKAASGSKLTFTGVKRFFLDEVVVTDLNTPAPTVSAKLNASGYATFCSQYPLDFTGITAFSAWQITDISTSNEITFERVTGAVKGGTGLFLKGEAGDINIPSTDSSNDISSTNKLVGTTAPTYFAEGEIYGLAGDTFKKNSAGSIRANKAYIPANLITVSGSGNGGGAKAFTFIFDDEATGIKTIETVSAEEAAQIFNLAGQRINKMQKGINIVNGKKIMVK